MFTVNPVVVIDDTFMNPAVEPDIVAVTFGALANAVENVIANVPELVVPFPYKYLVILKVDTFAVIDDTFIVIDDTFAVIDDTFLFTVDTFAAIISTPAFKVVGMGEIQFTEAAGM